MKKIVLAFSMYCVSIAMASGQTAIDYKDLGIGDAQTVSMVEQKNILVAFTSESSKESKELEKLLDTKKISKSINKSLIAVHADMDSEKDFEWFAKYRVAHVPMLSIIDPLGNEVDRIAGEITKDRIDAFLSSFKDVNPEIFNPTKDVETAEVISRIEPSTISQKEKKLEAVVDVVKTPKNVVTSEKVSKPKVSTPREPVSTQKITTSEVTATIESASSNSDYAGASTHNEPLTEGRSYYPPDLSEFRKTSAIVYVEPSTVYNDPEPVPTYIVKRINEERKSLEAKESKASKKVIKKTPKKIFSTSYRIHFATFESEDSAIELKKELEKSLAKEIELSETEDGFKVFTREFSSKKEAKLYVKRRRADGIPCFLLAN